MHCKSEHARRESVHGGRRISNQAANMLHSKYLLSNVNFCVFVSSGLAVGLGVIVINKDLKTELSDTIWSQETGLTLGWDITHVWKG